MGFLSSKQSMDFISGIIHADTQRHADRIDLTVSKVHRITGAGTLDFGGSEFKPATSEKLNPEKQKPEDDYGWWKLGQGPYKITFNESLDLPEGVFGIIVPHVHAREAGLIANSIIFSSDDTEKSLFMNVTVSEAGCNIKENARIATIYLLES